ncbi:MAG: hypothetical protein ACYTKD_08545 [Planctomycetota bacterium]|jgi:hypothetical protein
MVDAGNRSEGLSRSVRVTILVTVAAAALGAVVVLLPAVMATTVRVPHSKCSSRLWQIGYACQLYAGDNDGRFPPDLATLYPDYISDPDLFVCKKLRYARRLLPHDDPAVSALPEEKIAFCYVSGLRASEAPDTVLAFGEEWNHEGEGTYVLTVGGQVSWERDLEALHACLDEQAEAFRGRGREVKLLRPPWSRWPERPQYPPVPWDRRKAIPALVVGAAASLVLLVGAILFRPWKRRRA